MEWSGIYDFEVYYSFNVNMIARVIIRKASSNLSSSMRRCVGAALGESKGAPSIV